MLPCTGVFPKIYVPSRTLKPLLHDISSKSPYIITLFHIVTIVDQAFVLPNHKSIEPGEEEFSVQVPEQNQDGLINFGIGFETA